MTEVMLACAECSIRRFLGVEPLHSGRACSKKQEPVAKLFIGKNMTSNGDQLNEMMSW